MAVKYGDEFPTPSPVTKELPPNVDDNGVDYQLFFAQLTTFIDQQRAHRHNMAYETLVDDTMIDIIRHSIPRTQFIFFFFQYFVYLSDLHRHGFYQEEGCIAKHQRQRREDVDSPIYAPHFGLLSTRTHSKTSNQQNQQRQQQSSTLPFQLSAAQQSSYHPDSQGEEPTPQQLEQHYSLYGKPQPPATTMTTTSQQPPTITPVNLHNNYAFHSLQHKTTCFDISPLKANPQNFISLHYLFEMLLIFKPHIYDMVLFIIMGLYMLNNTTATRVDHNIEVGGEIQAMLDELNGTTVVAEGDVAANPHEDHQQQPQGQQHEQNQQQPQQQSNNPVQSQHMTLADQSQLAPRTASNPGSTNADDGDVVDETPAPFIYPDNLCTQTLLPDEHPLEECYQLAQALQQAQLEEAAAAAAAARVTDGTAPKTINMVQLAQANAQKLLELKKRRQDELAFRNNLSSFLYTLILIVFYYIKVRQLHCYKIANNLFLEAAQLIEAFTLCYGKNEKSGGEKSNNSSGDHSAKMNVGTKSSTTTTTRTTHSNNNKSRNCMLDDHILQNSVDQPDPPEPTFEERKQVYLRESSQALLYSYHITSQHELIHFLVRQQYTILTTLAQSQILSYYVAMLYVSLSTILFHRANYSYQTAYFYYDKPQLRHIHPERDVQRQDALFYNQNNFRSTFDPSASEDNSTEDDSYHSTSTTARRVQYMNNSSSGSYGRYARTPTHIPPTHKDRGEQDSTEYALNNQLSDVFNGEMLDYYKEDHRIAVKRYNAVQTNNLIVFPHILQYFSLLLKQVGVVKISTLIPQSFDLYRQQQDLIRAYRTRQMQRAMILQRAQNTQSHFNSADPVVLSPEAQAQCENKVIASKHVRLLALKYINFLNHNAMFNLEQYVDPTSVKPNSSNNNSNNSSRATTHPNNTSQQGYHNNHQQHAYSNQNNSNNNSGVHLPTNPNDLRYIALDIITTNMNAFQGIYVDLHLQQIPPARAETSYLYPPPPPQPLAIAQSYSPHIPSEALRRVKTPMEIPAAVMMRRRWCVHYLYLTEFTHLIRIPRFIAFLPPTAPPRALLERLERANQRQALLKEQAHHIQLVHNTLEWKGKLPPPEFNYQVPDSRTFEMYTETPREAYGCIEKGQRPHFPIIDSESDADQEEAERCQALFAADQPPEFFNTLDDPKPRQDISQRLHHHNHDQDPLLRAPFFQQCHERYYKALTHDTTDLLQQLYNSFGGALQCYFDDVEQLFNFF